MPSVDLTTLPGWASLSTGSHNITIVAKAAGYRDSEPSAVVSVTKGPAVVMPNKGDIITLDSKQYRVLKTEGTVAEVLCMYDSNSRVKFDSASSRYNNTYAGKSLDTYCNQTFYNSLSSTMQNAIVAKTFQQDEWWRDFGTSGGTGNPIYQGIYDTTGSNGYRVGLTNATKGTSISRKCYVLSCQDVIDYLEVTPSMDITNTTLTVSNIRKMFWNQTTSISSFPWLRSARAGQSKTDEAFGVSGTLGCLDSFRVDNGRKIRPAFQIDLSKIAWSK